MRTSSTNASRICTARLALRTSVGTQATPVLTWSPTTRRSWRSPPGWTMMTEVSIAVVFPDLLGTYGDGGNATILAQRLRWRGIPATVTEIHADDTVPETCDLYVLGGGEDAPQTFAADRLIESGVLNRAVDRGAVVFAVCAGLQV